MGQSEGMQTLEMQLSMLVHEGIVALEDAAARSLYPKEIKRPILRAVPAGRG